MIEAWEGNLRIDAGFIAAGADINSINRNGGTALLLSPRLAGQDGGGEVLLDRGAASTPATSSGRRSITPSFPAIRRCQAPHRPGADINAKTNSSSDADDGYLRGRENRRGSSSKRRRPGSPERLGRRNGPCTQQPTLTRMVLARRNNA